jgi:glutamyl-tRNA synthetase
MKEADHRRLAALTETFLTLDGCRIDGGPPLLSVIALLKDRVATLRELADAAVFFYRPLAPSPALRAQHYTAQIKPALADLLGRFKATTWNRAAINDAIKGVVAAHQLKMPKLAMPLRVMVTGETQTPSIDATLELIGHDEVLARMAAQLANFPD